MRNYNTNFRTFDFNYMFHLSSLYNRGSGVIVTLDYNDKQYQVHLDTQGPGGGLADFKQPLKFEFRDGTPPFKTIAYVNVDLTRKNIVKKMNEVRNKIISGEISLDNPYEVMEGRK